MTILRVFTKRTSFTPTDELVRIGRPTLFDRGIECDEVHISVPFTWDKPEAEALAEEWAFLGKPVKLGGPAYHSEAGEFTPGMYIKKGVTFTSRGCNNNCPWCGVREIEGKLREIPITEGHIIQDNNFLQCSRAHKEKVFDMLRGQHGISFRGGLEPDLIDDHFINGITSLRIAELWLACDTDAALPTFRKACEKLKQAGFPRWKIRCYSLIGHDMEKEEARNREIYLAGAIPFSQLERDFTTEKTVYSKEWRAFERTWQRPAAINAHMRDVENGKDQINLWEDET